MENEIKKILEEKVNPILAEHYGSAEFTAFEDGVVWVKMMGACGQCPSAQDTIENVVREIIVGNVEGVVDVRLDKSVSDDLIDMAKKILNKDI